MKIEKRVPQIVRKSGEILGAVAPTFIADPTGLLGLIITSIGEVASDTLNKKLSERERIRTNMAYQYFVEKLNLHQENGLMIRDDEFFRFSVGRRKKFEELFEAILLKSKDQYEEEKVKFFSNLYANGCIDTSLTPQTISLFIVILDKLTFHHLDVLNKFYILGADSNWEYNDRSYLSTKNINLPTYLAELQNLNLITPTFYGDAPLKITNLGEKLINSIEFENRFDDLSNEIILKNKN